jgi:3-deoxy-manno-octulosonate cytidylyltransferase (CMP-KDO synthetase)
MRPIIVIPARYSSTRLPGKPLVRICGKPLIQWVVERASRCTCTSDVLVATDDARIAEAVRAFGGRCVMTRTDHPSGTDRIAEAVAGRDAEIIINVQGDEPLIDPMLIDALAAALDGPGAPEMATAASPIADLADLRNRAVVKVVCNAAGHALYFSREPIPHVRDAQTDEDILASGLHRRHIGIYAYRRAFLERLVAAPPAPLETAEKLEQLRALHLGARIRVLETDHVGVGVDTPEDIPRAERALREAGLAP